MKLFLKIAVPVLILALVAWLGIRRFRTVVPVAAAERGAAVNAVTGTVKIYANMDLHVKTEVPGRVEEVPVKQDEVVKKGQILVRLASTDLEQQLEQAEIQLQAARDLAFLPYGSEIELQNRREDLDRVRQQVKYGNAGAADEEKAERAVQAASAALQADQINRQSQVDLLQAKVRQLRSQIDRMNIRAPFDGKIVTQLCFPGDFLWSGNEITRLVSPGRWANLTLAEEDAFGVEKGQAVTLRLASYPGEAIHGEVSALAPTADADKKTRDVYLNVDAPDDKLVPGLTGEAVLVKAERQGAIIVPRRALIGNRVYVVSGGTVDIRAVKPGFLSLNKAEILDGVKEGELVVLEGQSLLRDGQSVVPQQEGAEQ